MTQTEQQTEFEYFDTENMEWEPLSERDAAMYLVESYRSLRTALVWLMQGKVLSADPYLIRMAR